MISDIIIHQVEHYGYLIFFLAFCLGPFGIPVPNEVTLLTGAILSNKGALNPWLVYISILVGLFIAITISFAAGRLFGEKFNKKLQENRYFEKANNLFKKHGDLAMCLAFFVPIVRYMFPLLVGLSNVSFKKFALISYSSAFVWTSTFFVFGKFVGSHLGDMLNPLFDQKMLLLLIMVASSSYIVLKRRSNP
ncbi:DedA family protein [Paenibacillus sp. PR3]|uniref:DedA family protein n=1 Tax=Paenibacillus terricola TaxID=2763503 RepID=A0ABR8MYI8_9BACL|nr:DedA family protein [Paenibacillus terricola]MBD3919995.1 DedA family protein [Paenibacillus terricola]